MSTIINNLVQNFSVWKKETEQPKPARQGEKVDESQVRDADTANGTKDTVEIQNPIRYSIESNQVSRESSVTDVDDAQRLLQKVIGLMNSGNEISQAEPIYDFNQENLVKLLS